MSELNATHRTALRSWRSSADAPSADFPMQKPVVRALSLSRPRAPFSHRRRDRRTSARFDGMWGGKKPIALPNGEKRTFLEGGDTMILQGWCEAEGAVRIRPASAVGTVLP